MLYELILINEIEQRAKIIFLSAASKHTLFISADWCSDGSGMDRLASLDLCKLPRVAIC